MELSWEYYLDKGKISLLASDGGGSNLFDRVQRDYIVRANH